MDSESDEVMVSSSAMIDAIMPYMVSYGILPRPVSPSDIKESDFKELATRWKIKIIEPKHNRPLKKEQIVKALYAQTELMEMRKGGRRHGNILAIPDLTDIVPMHAASGPGMSQKLIKPLNKNYFGLPPYALNRTANGIVYQCRKPYDRGVGYIADDDEELQKEIVEQKADFLSEVNKTEHKKTENHSAQRKVAQALVAMASNDQMLAVFVFKGGVDAVIKLSLESTDADVLTLCAQSLIYAAGTLPHCTHLMEKQIISVLNSLAENGSEETRRQCSICLSKLTMQRGLDSVLVQAGVLLSLQSLLNNSAAHDIVSYSILSLCNIAPSVTGGDAEAVIRLCLQGCKRLDFLHSYDAAHFISKIFCNLSRIPHYVSLLVEEGVLPMMLSLMECQPHINIMSAIVEALFNMSMLRKNRRDIQSSGISTQLARILDVENEECRAHAMLLVGNLLAAGYFQDKVAKEDMLARLIGLLDPNCSVQCYAASYCVAHLSQSESCSTTMVAKCDMLPIAIKLLSLSMESSTSAYLWTSLANFTCFNGLLGAIMENPKFIPLICDDSKTAEHQEVVAQLMLNLSQHSMLYTQLDQALFTKLITAYKLLFIRGTTASVRLLAISMLTNVALSVPESRGFLLGGDLIDIIEESGLTNPAINVRYLTLVYLISKEPQLCPKLVDFGAQRLLMTILPTVTTNEAAKDTIAATLHNLSLKRALLGTGVLEALLAFAKNCKTIRVLWCARTLANISSYPRSRATLSKEKKVIPFLSAIMRYGCVEADRVQHYCALAICNILSSHVDKDILQGLVRSGAVVDLVVVTLLRVNSITTKEALGRALFNLLSLADYREELVVQLDVLEALLELGRIERIEMLELSVKAIFNITCETPTYSAKLAELKLPHLMVSRSIAAPELQGAIPTTAVKLSCGQSIANMSFDRKLAQIMTSEKMSESCVAIVNIDTDEARYCACATLYNLSFLDSCISLANSQVVPLLVSMLTSGPVLCIQLAVGALCNFSLFEVFHDQLTALAIGPAINAINAPHLDSNIKLDCLYIIYNVITCFAPCQAKAIDDGVISALLKIIKTNDSEEIVGVVSRVVKEICTMVTMARKLLTDGVMSIILKLSKFEIPLVKLDLAVAMFNLSMTVEFSLKMLKLDTVDILFWLTIYDCLNLFDPIRKNVVRCLRNFTISAEDCVYICKEERLTSVLKVLIKSTSEDVLYNTAVVIYNLLNCSATVVADCRATLLRRGVIQLIFDLAASGYMSVRHICSASLHSVADHIPESDDPAVLQLIMCLLDADGDQFSQLGEKVGTLLPYTQAAAFRGTRFDHTGTSFTANWLPLASDVDNIFKAAQLDFDVVSSGQVEVTPLNPTIVTVQAPQKFTGLEFDDFRDSSRPATTEETSHDDWDQSPEQLPPATQAPNPHPPEPSRPPIKSMGSRTSSWLDTDDPNAKLQMATSSFLPAIIKPKTPIPDDTVRLIQQNEYKPKGSTKMSNMQKNFQNAGSKSYRDLELMRQYSK